LSLLKACHSKARIPKIDYSLQLFYHAYQLS
jgi:hypothetical protein